MYVDLKIFLNNRMSELSLQMKEVAIQQGLFELPKGHEDIYSDFYKSEK